MLVNYISKANYNKGQYVVFQRENCHEKDGTSTINFILQGRIKKMVVVYFSGTGNSKHIAEKFTDRMQIEAHSIEENIDFGKMLKYDTSAFYVPRQYLEKSPKSQ